MLARVTGEEVSEICISSMWLYLERWRGDLLWNLRPLFVGCSVPSITLLTIFLRLDRGRTQATLELVSLLVGAGTEWNSSCGMESAVGSR